MNIFEVCYNDKNCKTKVLSRQGFSKKHIFKTFYIPSGFHTLIIKGIYKLLQMQIFLHGVIVAEIHTDFVN